MAVEGDVAPLASSRELGIAGLMWKVGWGTIKMTMCGFECSCHFTDGFGVLVVATLFCHDCAVELASVRSLLI